MFLRKHFLGEKDVSELEDVIENLGNVLRTKRGAGYFLPNFGLSDTGYRTSEEMITGLTAEIRENVRLYEPRVELIDVDDEYDDDGDRVRLVIQMKLRSKDEVIGLLRRSQEEHLRLPAAKPEAEGAERDVRRTPSPELELTIGTTSKTVAAGDIKRLEVKLTPWGLRRRDRVVVGLARAVVRRRTSSRRSSATTSS